MATAVQEDHAARIRRLAAEHADSASLAQRDSDALQDAIVDALDAGMTRRDVARHTGLAPSRISAITARWYARHPDTVQ